ncbi:unnamed protein product [Choristocarpus tenellus]
MVSPLSTEASPSHGEDVDSVLAERALERISVSEARALLRQLTSQVGGKQTELQLMVGSRYHELIESADSILSMKETAEEVKGLLHEFPKALECVLGQVPDTMASTDARQTDLVYRQAAATVKNSEEVTRLMLKAPAAMWSALDRKRHLEAAGLLLRCRHAMAQGPLHVSQGLDASGAAFLKSQCAYVEHFPPRIVAAAKALLTQPCSTDACAGALAAVLLIQGHEEANPTLSLLELLLQRRGGAIIKSCKRVMAKATREMPEQVLCDIFQAIRNTILDVHAIFAARSGDRPCLAVELAMLSDPQVRFLSLSSCDVTRTCTSWLSLLVPRIHACSKNFLCAIDDANTLACIRGKLWTVTHGTSHDSGNASGTITTQGSSRVAERSPWCEACTFAVDTELLRGQLAEGCGEISSYHPIEGKSLDLWSLLLSQMFAELAEALLKDSLRHLYQDVQGRLDTILLSITSSGPGLRNSRVDQTGHGQVVPELVVSRRLMSQDVLEAAQEVTELLNSELLALVNDAWSLVQQGDDVAAEALERSLFYLNIEAVSGLVNHLRVTLEGICSCLIPSERTNRRTKSIEGCLPGFGDAGGCFADAGLVIGRIAWLLMNRRGRALRSVLTVPPSSAADEQGQVEAQQLEAAFVIADTDGDGVVDADEAVEALEAISFGSRSVSLSVDPQVYSSFTLAEFSLFATRLLLEQQPHPLLVSCLESVLQQSISMWAEWTFRTPTALLHEATEWFAAACRAPGTTDELWRDRHGVWEEKKMELEYDGDEGVDETIPFPVVVSPAILCYIESASSELGRITCTADLAVAGTGRARVPAMRPEVGEGAGTGSREKGQGPGPEGTAECVGPKLFRCAQALAVSRASRDLEEVMLRLCVGPTAVVDGACEAVQLQILLDALFLRQWLPCREPGASPMDPIISNISDLLDPINLEIYMPHLKDAAGSCSRACRTFLLSLFMTEDPGCLTNVSPQRPATGDFLGSSSTLLTLAPKVRRFDLLPMPLDVATLPTSRKPLIPSVVGGNVVVGAGLGDLEDSDQSEQQKGIQVGRQALAGLMGQVGNVGSVLTGQNVNMQNMLGAASVFLGRQRK